MREVVALKCQTVQCSNESPRADPPSPKTEKSKAPVEDWSIRSGQEAVNGWPSQAKLALLAYCHRLVAIVWQEE